MCCSTHVKVNAPRWGCKKRNKKRLRTELKRKQKKKRKETHLHALRCQREHGGGGMDSEQEFSTCVLGTQSDATQAVDTGNLGHPRAAVVCGYDETCALLAIQRPCHGRAPRDPETNPQMHKRLRRQCVDTRYMLQGGCSAPGEPAHALSLATCIARQIKHRLKPEQMCRRVNDSMYR